MELLTLIGLGCMLYVIVYIVLLAIIDCDVGLFLALKFGQKLDYFRGKVVWITGASSGIGEYIAYELAKHDAKIVLSARSVDNLKRVKEECIKLGCPENNILILALDVTDFAVHEECFMKVIKHFGKLDVLINNAGRSQRAIWENIELEVDLQMFDLNVFSVISLSRIAVKYFQTRGEGHLVAMSSAAGIVGAPFSGTYTATKHALHGYYNSLKTEKMGENLAVTLLCPGPVFSNVLRQSFTANPGEIYGENMKETDRRMETTRCAQLCATAIANKLDEAWIGLFPVVPLLYLIVYVPNVAKWIVRLMGTKQLQKLRDSKQTVRQKNE